MEKFNSSTHSFTHYVRSMGPGIVVVLTWLGAGDLVEAATAGGNYGYALMWSFILALFFRYLFVSIISKYQLFNPHGETVIAGLCRVHKLYAPFIFVSGLLIAHAVGVYLLMGVAEICVKISGLGDQRIWAIFMSLLAFLSVFQYLYRRIEIIILVMAAVLTLSLLGLAVAVGPAPIDLAKGVIGFEVPQTIGRFDALKTRRTGTKYFLSLDRSLGDPFPTALGGFREINPS